MKKNTALTTLTPADIDRIVEMAWEDRTPFDAIEAQFGLSEQEVIQLMRQTLKRSSWQHWRARAQNRATKHRRKSAIKAGERFKCSRQRSISHNKVSKR
jgi:uncharacterized protein (TIGR03643 family)